MEAKNESHSLSLNLNDSLFQFLSELEFLPAESFPKNFFTFLKKTFSLINEKDLDLVNFLSTALPVIFEKEEFEENGLTCEIALSAQKLQSNLQKKQAEILEKLTYALLGKITEKIELSPQSENESTKEKNSSIISQIEKQLKNLIDSYLTMLESQSLQIEFIGSLSKFLKELEANNIQSLPTNLFKFFECALPLVNEKTPDLFNFLHLNLPKIFTQKTSNSTRNTESLANTLWSIKQEEKIKLLEILKNAFLQEVTIKMEASFKSESEKGINTRAIYQATNRLNALIVSYSTANLEITAINNKRKNFFSRVSETKEINLHITPGDLKFAIFNLEKILFPKEKPAIPTDPINAFKNFCKSIKIPENTTPEAAGNIIDAFFQKNNTSSKDRKINFQNTTTKDPVSFLKKKVQNSLEETLKKEKLTQMKKPSSQGLKVDEKREVFLPATQQPSGENSMIKTKKSSIPNNITQLINDLTREICLQKKIMNKNEIQTIREAIEENSVLKLAGTGIQFITLQDLHDAFMGLLKIIDKKIIEAPKIDSSTSENKERTEAHYTDFCQSLGLNRFSSDKEISAGIERYNQRNIHHAQEAFKNFCVLINIDKNSTSQQAATEIELLAGKNGKFEFSALGTREYGQRDGHNKTLAVNMTNYLRNILPKALTLTTESPEISLVCISSSSTDYTVPEEKILLIETAEAKESSITALQPTQSTAEDSLGKTIDALAEEICRLKNITEPAAIQTIKDEIATQLFYQHKVFNKTTEKRVTEAASDLAVKVTKYKNNPQQIGIIRQSFREFCSTIGISENSSVEAAAAHIEAISFNREIAFLGNLQFMMPGSEKRISLSAFLRTELPKPLSTSTSSTSGVAKSLPRLLRKITPDDNAENKRTNASTTAHG